VSWVDFTYIGEVPGYREAGVCLALASVRWMAAGGDNPICPWHPPPVHLGCRSLNWHDGCWQTSTACSPDPYNT